MIRTILTLGLCVMSLPVFARDAAHPAAPLADAIEANNCLFGEGDTAKFASETDLGVMDVISMTPKLIEDGYLIYEEDNLQRLVNWGSCASE